MATYQAVREYPNAVTGEGLLVCACVTQEEIKLAMMIHDGINSNLLERRAVGLGKKAR